MNYSVRLNGFLSKGYDLLDALYEISKIEGANYIDFNYPEHFTKYSKEELKITLEKLNLKVSSVAARFRCGFEKGEFTNRDSNIRRRAINIAKEAVDVAKFFDCESVILWFATDGFTYPFEADYAELWKLSKNSLVEVCDYDPNIKISIEYKPYEPRSFSLFSSACVTALMAADVCRDNIYVTIDLAHSYMKGEMPAFAFEVLNSRKLVNAIHVNDGYGLMDDGLIVGSVRFIQTLEFYYYLVKSNYSNVLYFDTFPIRENPVEEVKQNIKMSEKMFSLIDHIGLDKIEEIIKANDGVKAQEIMMMCLK